MLPKSLTMQWHVLVVLQLQCSILPVPLNHRHIKLKQAILLFWYNSFQMPPWYDNQLCKYITIIDITDVSQSTKACTLNFTSCNYQWNSINLCQIVCIATAWPTPTSSLDNNVFNICTRVINKQKSTFLHVIIAMYIVLLTVVTIVQSRQLGTHRYLNCILSWSLTACLHYRSLWMGLIQINF